VVLHDYALHKSTFTLLYFTLLPPKGENTCRDRYVPKCKISRPRQSVTPSLR